MAKRKKKSGPELFTSVDDDLYDELLALRGQRLVHVSLWDDSLADELASTLPGVEHGALYDIDLYLEEGVYFEFYGASGFPTLQDDALEDDEELQRTLLSLVNQNATLIDLAVDEEDNLVLVLGRRNTPRLYVVAGGWLPGEWEELPGA